MKITTINQEAIDFGIQQDSEQCPIAIAMKNNDYIEPTISKTNIEYYHSRTGHETTKKEVSRRISIRISRFDKGHKIRPFKIIEKENIFDIYKEK